MDYKNYIEMQNKLELINRDINDLYNKEIEIRMSLLPAGIDYSKDKTVNKISKDEVLEKMGILEEIEKTLIKKKELREEIHDKLLEIEKTATDKFKFKIFILRWFSHKSYRQISRLVPASKDTVKRVVEEIEKEIKTMEEESYTRF